MKTPAKRLLLADKAFRIVRGISFCKVWPGRYAVQTGCRTHRSPSP